MIDICQYNSEMSETDTEEYYDAEDENIHNNNSLIYTFRTDLPQLMASKANFSVWTFLKQCIGKELSKITMPIVFNEPISFLQRLTEYVEYSELIDEAAAETDPIKRMEKISAFAVSGGASNWGRIGKPFNPLLGETYEIHRPNFKYVSEQICHHPPISAFHVESPIFKFYGSIYPKLHFWGKSVVVTPRGNISLELLPWNEVYTWQNVVCTIHNVIIGKIWIEHSGPVRIINHSNNCIADLTFHSVGWFGKNMHRVDGDIYYAQGKSRHVERKIYGKWTEALFSVSPEVWDNESSGSKRHISSTDHIASIEKGDVDLSDVDDPLPKDNTPCDMHLSNQRLLWKARPRPSKSNDFYNFTSFTMGLNQLNETISKSLPPTDSRFRKDMRFMEEGLLDEAAVSKNMLEEKQRASRSSLKNISRKTSTKSPSSTENIDTSNLKQSPIWFSEKLNPHTGKVEWQFNSEYWKRDWTNCPDIFV